MLNDPEVYSQPSEFWPDRFKGDDAAMDNARELIFGFGRRACPGRMFAENSLFYILATTLATCDILPGLNDEGKEVLPSVSYISGTLTCVVNFSFDYHDH